MLVLGFLVIYYPAAGVVGIIAVSGSAFIVAGILNIYIAFQLKSLKDKIGHVKENIDQIKGKFGPA